MPQGFASQVLPEVWRDMEEAEVKVVPNEILLDAVSKLLSDGRSVIIRTKGSSMLPFVRGGRDSVRLSRHPDISVGDIVLAHLGNDKYVLHRVFSIDGDKVTLMGDGNLKGTELCRISDVCGTVDGIIRPGGKEKVPGDGALWRKLLPFRRYLVAFYRKILLPCTDFLKINI